MTGPGDIFSWRGESSVFQYDDWICILFLLPVLFWVYLGSIHLCRNDFVPLMWRLVQHYFIFIRITFIFSCLGSCFHIDHSLIAKLASAISIFLLYPDIFKGICSFRGLPMYVEEHFVCSGSGSLYYSVRKTIL